MFGDPQQLVGKVIGGYRLEAMLGTGAMGVVFRGQSAAAPQGPVAIKLLLIPWNASPADRAQYQARFRREAQTLQRLQHPHILSLLDFGDDQGFSYMVLPYMSGGTLATLLQQQKQIAFNQAAYYLNQLGSALDYAHSLNIIHRDIKPANILLDAQGRPSLADFSIVRFTDLGHTTLTVAGQAIGTPAYQAPEQGDRTRVGPASDIYSLGIVAYELVTGRVPFQGSDVNEYIQKHAKEPPSFPRLYRLDIPEPAEAAILQALAKDPTQRFSSAGAFAQAFAAGVQGQWAPEVRRIGSITQLPTQGFVVPPTQGVVPPSPPIAPSPSPLQRNASPPPAMPQRPNQQQAQISPAPAAQPPGYVPIHSGAGGLPPSSSPPVQRWNAAPPPGGSGPQKKTGGGRAAAVVLAILLLVAAGGGLTYWVTHNGSSTGTGNHPPTSTSGPSSASNGCKKIGVLLPENTFSPRWENEDHPLLDTDIKKDLPGASVDFYNANGDAAAQQNQADSALAKGDCILVVAAHDSGAAAGIVTKAKQSNVPVIAYDRLIQSSDLSFYVSFDPVKVGELQGQYIVDHHSSGDNVMMINGSQTDNNAILFRQGALNKLQPLFDSKELNLVYQTFTPNWDNQTAQVETEAALTQTANKVQIAYVANDGMANSVIAALKAQNLAGKVVVTGQDATIVGLQNILIGSQSMTVYKPLSLEAEATAQLVAALSNGSATDSLINGSSMTSTGANIKTIFVTPELVTKGNIRETVLKDGYVTTNDLCTGLPAGTDTGGICP